MRRAFGVVVLMTSLLAPASAFADTSGDHALDAGDPAQVTALVTNATHGSVADRKAAETQLVALGEAAVPALIVGAKRAPGEAMRKWCEDVLDEMGKRTAADEVQTKTDGALIAVFGAFGEIKDVDALSAIFPFVGADRLAIRNAARAALRAYGDSVGPRLHAEYTNLGGTIANDSPPTTEALLNAYFAIRDQLRLHDVVTIFDRGLAEAKTADLVTGIADLDTALAREPLLERRQEAAPFYVQYAHSLTKADRKAEREYDLKAQRIADPASEDAKHAAGDLAFLDAEDLREKGIVDRLGYQKALALDPQNESARAALGQLDAERTAREDKLRKTEAAAAASIAVTALLAAIFVAMRNRRKK